MFFDVEERYGYDLKLIILEPRKNKELMLEAFFHEIAREDF